ncbi:E3 ubiquitin-protein ligase TRIM56-like [Clytia hemisphaerica]|uniref:Uncharacterized protein n=1 Tax=Clytia hemisphaerica TaxID=252671 RepID=A0A7M6DL99_9CNID|eukprot:TCONS_00028402-protein
MAQQNTAYDEKVRQELECSICIDQYQKPKLLGCMHTFCEPCITRLIKNGTISCPQCRQVSKVPNGVSGLSTNYIAQNIIEKLKTSARGNQPCCHDCANGIPATNHCKNCVLNLCKDCTNYHQRCVRFVGHCIVAVSSVSQESVNQVRYCAKHKELLKYFCENCKVVVCNDCMISNQHKQHSMSLITEAKEKAKKELKQKLLKGLECKQNLLNTHKEGENFKKRVEAAEDKSVLLVKKVFVEIRKEVAKREKQLVDQIKKESNFQSFDKFSTALKKISDSLEYVKEVMKNDNYDNMEIIMDLSNHLDLLDKEFDFNKKYHSYENPNQHHHQNQMHGGLYYSQHQHQQHQPLLIKPQQNKVFICEQKGNIHHQSYHQATSTNNLSFQMTLVERDLAPNRNHKITQNLNEFQI